ncbi:MAG: cytochrome c oxidase subunit 3 [Dehalococcoidales bacterium]
MTDNAIAREKPLTSPMRMGMVFFLVSETFLFGALFWTYYYLRAETPIWPPQSPSATLAIANSVLLLTSSVTVWWGRWAIRRGNERGLFLGLLATLLLGCAFLGITGWEWTHEVFRPWTNAYGSIFYTMTGFHALHVFGGVVLMLALLARTRRHRFSAGNSLAVEVSSYYWHFVDFIWILVFTTLFIIR